MALGKIVYYVRKGMQIAWKPEDHPRDKDGKFIKGAGGVYTYGKTKTATFKVDGGTDLKIDLDPGDSLFETKAGNYYIRKADGSFIWYGNGTNAPKKFAVGTVKPPKATLVETVPAITVNAADVKEAAQKVDARIEANLKSKGATDTKPKAPLPETEDEPSPPELKQKEKPKPEEKKAEEKKPEEKKPEEKKAEEKKPEEKKPEEKKPEPKAKKAPKVPKVKITDPTKSEAWNRGVQAQQEGKSYAPAADEWVLAKLADAEVGSATSKLLMKDFIEGHDYASSQQYAWEQTAKGEKAPGKLDPKFQPTESTQPPTPTKNQSVVAKARELVEKKKTPKANAKDSGGSKFYNKFSPANIDPNGWEIVDTVVLYEVDPFTEEVVFNEPSQEFLKGLAPEAKAKGHHNCTSCGAALKYATFIENDKDEMIVIGQECATSLAIAADVKKKVTEVSKKLKDKNYSIKTKMLADDFLKNNPELKQILDKYAGKKSYASKIEEKLYQYGSVFPNQVTLLKNLAQKWDKQAATAQAWKDKPKIPVPEGKGRSVTGKIVSVKTEPNLYAYNSTITKMLVEDHSGFRVWGTMPKALSDKLVATGAANWEDAFDGVTVTFKANLSQSTKDENFGFFKNPSKVSTIGNLNVPDKKIDLVDGTFTLEHAGELPGDDLWLGTLTTLDGIEIGSWDEPLPRKVVEARAEKDLVKYLQLQDAKNSGEYPTGKDFRVSANIARQYPVGTVFGWDTSLNLPATRQVRLEPDGTFSAVQNVDDTLLAKINGVSGPYFFSALELPSTPVQNEAPLSTDVSTNTDVPDLYEDDENLDSVPTSLLVNGEPVKVGEVFTIGSGKTQWKVTQVGNQNFTLQSNQQSKVMSDTHSQWDKLHKVTTPLTTQEVTQKAKELLAKANKDEATPGGTLDTKFVVGETYKIGGGATEWKVFRVGSDGVYLESTNPTKKNKTQVKHLTTTHQQWAKLKKVGAPEIGKVTPEPETVDPTPAVPALTDAEFADHIKVVEKLLNENAHLDTASVHGEMSNNHPLFDVIWDEERARLHQEIIDDFLKKAEDIPKEKKIIFTGGLPGAGKSTGLRISGADQSTHLIIDPDGMKEALLAKGMAPEVEGLSPMETASLIHFESTDLAATLFIRAADEGYNIVYDSTMSRADSLQSRIDIAKKQGYTVDGMFMDVTVETSKQRAMARYREDLEKLRQNGEGFGGRYIPMDYIEWSITESEFESKNAESFEALKPQFENWKKWDSNEFPPKLVADSSTPPGGWTEYELVAAAPGDLATIGGQVFQKSENGGWDFLPGGYLPNSVPPLPDNVGTWSSEKVLSLKEDSTDDQLTVFSPPTPPPAPFKKKTKPTLDDIKGLVQGNVLLHPVSETKFELEVGQKLWHNVHIPYSFYVTDSDDNFLYRISGSGKKMNPNKNASVKHLELVYDGVETHTTPQRVAVPENLDYNTIFSYLDQLNDDQPVTFLGKEYTVESLNEELLNTLFEPAEQSINYPVGSTFAIDDVVYTKSAMSGNKWTNGEETKWFNTWFVTIPMAKITSGVFSDPPPEPEPYEISEDTTPAMLFELVSSPNSVPEGAKISMGGKEYASVEALVDSLSPVTVKSAEVKKGTKAVFGDKTYTKVGDGTWTSEGGTEFKPLGMWMSTIPLKEIQAVKFIDPPPPPPPPPAVVELDTSASALETLQLIIPMAPTAKVSYGKNTYTVDQLSNQLTQDLLTLVKHGLQYDAGDTVTIAGKKFTKAENGAWGDDAGNLLVLRKRLQAAPYTTWSSVKFAKHVKAEEPAPEAPTAEEVMGEASTWSDLVDLDNPDDPGSTTPIPEESYYTPSWMGSTVLKGGWVSEQYANEKFQFAGKYYANFADLQKGVQLRLNALMAALDKAPVGTIFNLGGSFYKKTETGWPFPTKNISETALNSIEKAYFGKYKPSYEFKNGVSVKSYFIKGDFLRDLFRVSAAKPQYYASDYGDIPITEDLVAHLDTLKKYVDSLLSSKKPKGKSKVFLEEFSAQLEAYNAWNHYYLDSLAGKAIPTAPPLPKGFTDIPWNKQPLPYFTKLPKIAGDIQADIKFKDEYGIDLNSWDKEQIQDWLVKNGYPESVYLPVTVDYKSYAKMLVTGQTNSYLDAAKAKYEKVQALAEMTDKPVTVGSTVLKDMPEWWSDQATFTTVKAYFAGKITLNSYMVDGQLQNLESYGSAFPTIPNKTYAELLALQEQEGLPIMDFIQKSKLFWEGSFTYSTPEGWEIPVPPGGIIGSAGSGKYWTASEDAVAKMKAGQNATQALWKNGELFKTKVKAPYSEYWVPVWEAPVKLTLTHAINDGVTLDPDAWNLGTSIIESWNEQVRTMDAEAIATLKATVNAVDPTVNIATLPKKVQTLLLEHPEVSDVILYYHSKGALTTITDADRAEHLEAVWAGMKQEILTHFEGTGFQYDTSLPFDAFVDSLPESVLTEYVQALDYDGPPVETLSDPLAFFRDYVRGEAALRNNTWLDALETPGPVGTFDKLYAAAKKNVGGQYEKKFWVNASGDTVMGKGAPDNRKFRVDSEQAANDLARRLGFTVAPSQAKEVDGEYTFLQTFFPNVVGDFTTITHADQLTDAQLKDTMASHVVDWMVANHDAHGGNFLQLGDGKIAKIDLGQAFKALGQDYLYPTNFHGSVWYDRVYSGPISKERLDMVAKHVLRKAYSTSAMSDAEYTKYVQSAVQNRAKFPGGVSKEEFIQKALDRKNNLLNDFYGMYQKVYAAKGYEFPFEKDSFKSQTLDSADPTTTDIHLANSTDLAQQVLEFGTHGKSLMVDSLDIEDSHILFYSTNNPDQSKNLNADMIVREGAQKRIESLGKKIVSGEVTDSQFKIKSGVWKYDTIADSAGADGQVTITGEDSGAAKTTEVYNITTDKVPGLKIQYALTTSGSDRTNGGRMKITFPNFSGDPDRIDQVLATLRELGVQFEEASDESLELFYYRHIIGQMQVHSQSTLTQNQKKILEEGRKAQGKNGELATLRTLFATEYDLSKVDWTPKFGHTMAMGGQPDATTGRPFWWRPDMSQDMKNLKKWAKGGRVASRISWSNKSEEGWGDAQTRAYKAGVFLSYEDRWRVVGKVPGGSNSSDQQVGGSGHTYWRLGSKSYPDNNQWLEPHVFFRTQAYGIGSDSFGNKKKKAASAPWNNKDKWDAVVVTYGTTEFNIKNGVSIFDDMAVHIVQNATKRKFLIDELKKRGITEVRGIPVTERIVATNEEADKTMAKVWDMAIAATEASIGEIRKFNGVEYMKRADGTWRKVGSTPTKWEGEA